MKGLLIITITLFFGLSSVKSQSQHAIRVKVTAIKQQKGSIRVCLATEAQFLSDCLATAYAKVTAEDMELTIEEILPGNYAISLYHDKDDNGQLKRGLFGIPAEPYGFSNNPKSTFGPPKFEACQFELNAHTTLSIKLR